MAAYEDNRKDPCHPFSTGVSIQPPMQDPFLFIYTTLLLHTPKLGACLCGKQTGTALGLAAKANLLFKSYLLKEAAFEFCRV